LQNILREVKRLKLRSINQLDLNSRGRLLTTLLRVGRQKGPAPTSVPPVEPSAEAKEPSPSEGPVAAQEPAPTETVPPVAVPPAPPSPEELRSQAYREVMFLVGSIWEAAGDQRRAEVAFVASGRKAEDDRPPPPEPASEWRDEARVLEGRKQTRDAARLHERHHSYAEAGRLFEAGGDLVSALRCALESKDGPGAHRLLKQLKPEQFLPLIERAKAHQLLMEHYVESGDFENVARLYERARQFDQAALAWERSGKLAAARKAYERAHDSGSAERIRKLEVDALVKRGDRLGAALLLANAGRREEAVQVLSPLPPPKAFRFLQKIKLDDEAMELAKKEIARAEAENRPAGRARWLELVGDAFAAAEAWELAGRRDKALALQEQAGNWQRAAELAESLGQLEKAAELYHRSGDKSSADRVGAMRAKVAAPPPSAPVAPLEGQGEER
jgi:tetratricopeptide (TPR) repeat protein